MQKTSKNEVPSKSTKADELEFLPAALEVLETPPAVFGRIASVVISSFFAFAVMWAWFGTVDVVAVSEGQTILKGRIKDVQPLESGVVRAIHVEDGEHVEKGELLIELDPTETAANVQSLQFDLMQSRVDAAMASALLDENSFGLLRLPDDVPPDLVNNSQVLIESMLQRQSSALSSIAAEISRHKAILRNFEIERLKLAKTLPLVKGRLDAQQSLFDKSMSTRPELVALQKEYYESTALLDGTVESKAENRAAIAGLEARRNLTVAEFRTNAADLLTKATRKIAVISQTLLKEERRRMYRQLRAPVSGTVNKLSVHTVGAVVETAQKLMTIVPDNTPLEIEALILNKDIGFVEVGQLAEIKLEAFPFTRYGMIPGSVIDISRDVLSNDLLGPVYKAKIALASQAMFVEGNSIPLSPGMKISAEIKTGSRRIIEFFLSPILRYRDESIRER